MCRTLLRCGRQMTSWVDQILLMVVEVTRRKVALVVLFLILLVFAFTVSPTLFPPCKLPVVNADLAYSELQIRLTITKCSFKFTERYSLSRKPFSLPDDYSKPPADVLAEQWACELRNFLGRMESNTSERLVSIIAADSNFTGPLLNWLIAALLRTDQPIRNLLVISLDAPLHTLLKSRSIDSLFVSPDSVMYTSQFPHQYHRHNSFYQTRLTIMRIINYWGFDVANYDTDALILRNPNSLYNQYPNVDIFGGVAISYPPHLHRLWGVTLCCGSWMVRSSAKTGKC